MIPPAALLAWTGFVSAVGFVVLSTERATPVAFDARTMSLLFREAGARALIVLLLPVGLGDSSPRRAKATTPRAPGEKPPLPVLLVPGFRQNRSCMFFLRTFLVSRGFGWVWPVSPSTRDGTLATQAAEVAARVQELKAASGADRVDIVGHSIGGLAAAWYVKHLDGHRHVRRLVTLGTPWKGTRLAVFVRSPIGREIANGAPVLDGLVPPAVPTVSVWSEDDPFVIPSRAALPDGVESVRLEGTGHVEMLTSSRAFRAVQAALSIPLPSGGA